jgi:hypothetical protein
VRFDAVPVDRQGTFSRVARLRPLVLSRVEGGLLGEHLGRFRVQLLGALERGQSALGVAVGLEAPRQHELVVGLRRRDQRRRLRRGLGGRRRR